MRRRPSWMQRKIKHKGRPMERALLRARQRYECDKRALTTLSRLRTAYARRTR